MKHDWKPGTMIYPLPAVMVSCGNEPSEYNIITVACRYDLYESGDVLYIRTSGTILLSDLEEEYGIRHQLDES